MKVFTHWHWLILAREATSLSPYRSSRLALVTRLCNANDLAKAQFEIRPLLVNYSKVANFVGQPALWGCGGLAGVAGAPFALSTWTLPRHRRGTARALRSLDHAFLVSGLHRFSENLGGAAFSLLIFRNLLEVASPQWLLEIYFFYTRLNQLFRLARGRRAAFLNAPRHPWYGGSQVIISAVHSRDPFLLTQWITQRMGTMRLFAHKKFLRLLGSFLRTYVSLAPSPSTVLGFHLVTTGKISVTGNAMSRTMLVRYGKAGVNNLSYRASSSFALIRTKTGCLGLNLVFYY